MCGIVGFTDRSLGRSRDDLEGIAARMAHTIRHRGPDDHGVWSDPESGIAFGHRRLSIIDLSQLGHQPMRSASGRYIVSYNGEIYNFLILRKELEALGQSFQGRSDTEVMLAAFDQWGVKGALPRLNGMFAFAVWDRQERLLHLVRDRLGEKPLYYAWKGGLFLFASELKAMLAYPGFAPEIDRNALTLLFRHCYIPAPHSIYRGVYKLPPGTSLTLSLEESFPSTSPPEAYWSAAGAATDGEAQRFQGSEEEAVARLEALLEDAVGMRMIADVPMGAFLSGGIDSSTIVALMQAQSARKVRTFSIGFHEQGFNEAHHAKAVAEHLGTEHTELYVSPREAREVIPRLPELYDEPFSDFSQIPTFLISRMTRSHVKVGLTGDGGDELFGGYDRYFWAQRMWGSFRHLPAWIRPGLSKSLTRFSPQCWNATLGAATRLLPGKYRMANLGIKVHRLASLLRSNNLEELYSGLVSHWMNPETIVLGGEEPHTPLTDKSAWLELRDPRHRMMYLDTITYLPDDILTKVDRASMGVSLETRIPLLDHRVVEFAWQVPPNMKFRDGQGKWLLRQVLNRHVPKYLIERPKMGFGVPIGEWLRGPLRDWAEALLNPERISREGILAAGPIQEKWREHLQGGQNWQYHLWDILMFQAWYEKI